MKNCTDLEQSKKLAEILPLESADGFWPYHKKWYSEGDEWEGYEDYPKAEPYLEYTHKENEWKEEKQDIPCWSLAALLDVLPDESDIVKGKLNVEYYKYMCTACIKDEVITVFGDNLLDVCYEMIIKLYKRKLL